MVSGNWSWSIFIVILTNSLILLHCFRACKECAKSLHSRARVPPMRCRRLLGGSPILHNTVWFPIVVPFGCKVSPGNIGEGEAVRIEYWLMFSVSQNSRRHEVVGVQDVVTHGSIDIPESPHIRGNRSCVDIHLR